MNWLILISAVIFALVATLLGILGFRTFKAIKHLGTGKSFWIPVFLSGVLFLAGSIFTILREVDFSLTAKTGEVVQISQLLALCILLGGVYSYSRRVSKNFAEKFTIAEKVGEEKPKMEAPVAHAKPPIQGRILQGNPKTETAQECKHQFRYLQTLPKNASIPVECFSCRRIIQCKHSLEKTSESRTLPLKA
ncbi:MAG: hypothetical protein JSV75_04170 [Candidatus Bathyarchaeota archaeon]|nr:MAG: hypothetical protein JSV75_04170 [Candidatus Bathyarchaeota archaeon]